MPVRVPSPSYATPLRRWSVYAHQIVVSQSSIIAAFTALCAVLMRAGSRHLSLSANRQPLLLGHTDILVAHALAPIIPFWISALVNEPWSGILSAIAWGYLLLMFSSVITSQAMIAERTPALASLPIHYSGLAAAHRLSRRSTPSKDHKWTPPLGWAFERSFHKSIGESAPRTKAQTGAGVEPDERDQLLQAILASTQDLISLTDETGQCIFASSAYNTVLGHDPGTLVGRPLTALIHQEDHQHAPWLSCGPHPGESRSGQLRVQHADCSWRWVEVTTRPVRQHGQSYMLTVARDISICKQVEAERKDVERKLQESQKLETLGLLAGGIAHDFNNLLGTIMGNAGLALLDLEPDSPARESVEQIELAAHHAADLIRQLLAYAGKGRLIIQPINLNSLITEMAQLLQPTMAPHVTIHYQLATELPTVEGDATQLRQVMMNLIVNAADAIGAQPGTIKLASAVQWLDRAELDTAHSGAELMPGRYIVLEVADSGCGMDGTTSAKIFEPFFTTKLSGRGLGLAAAQGIIRDHHGALKVESTIGIGTTFTILLPISGESATPENMRMERQPRTVRSS
jgi:PAS domain S-box-containing protein